MSTPSPPPSSSSNQQSCFQWTCQFRGCKSKKNQIKELRKRLPNGYPHDCDPNLRVCTVCRRLPLEQQSGPPVTQQQGSSPGGPGTPGGPLGTTTSGTSGSSESVVTQTSATQIFQSPTVNVSVVNAPGVSIFGNRTATGMPPPTIIQQQQNLINLQTQQQQQSLKRDRDGQQTQQQFQSPQVLITSQTGPVGAQSQVGVINPNNSNSVTVVASSSSASTQQNIADSKTLTSSPNRKSESLSLGADGSSLQEWFDKVLPTDSNQNDQQQESPSPSEIESSDLLDQETLDCIIESLDDIETKHKEIASMLKHYKNLSGSSSSLTSNSNSSSKSFLICSQLSKAFCIKVVEGLFPWEVSKAFEIIDELVVDEAVHNSNTVSTSTNTFSYSFSQLFPKVFPLCFKKLDEIEETEEDADLSKRGEQKKIVKLLMEWGTLKLWGLEHLKEAVEARIKGNSTNTSSSDKETLTSTVTKTFLSEFRPSKSNEDKNNLDIILELLQEIKVDDEIDAKRRKLDSESTNTGNSNESSTTPSSSSNIASNNSSENLNFIEQILQTNDPFQILNVKKEDYTNTINTNTGQLIISKEEIQQKQTQIGKIARKLMFMCHPDKNPNIDNQKCTDVMAKITDAKDKVIDYLDPDNKSVREGLNKDDGRNPNTNTFVPGHGMPGFVPGVYNPMHPQQMNPEQFCLIASSSSSFTGLPGGPYMNVQQVDQYGQPIKQKLYCQFPGCKDEVCGQCAHGACRSHITHCHYFARKSPWGGRCFFHPPPRDNAVNAVMVNGRWQQQRL